MTKEWQEAANEKAVEQKMDPFTVRAGLLSPLISYAPADSRG
jgi:hypothetical protein